MTAEELRLGNWILNIAGNPVQVRGLTNGGVWIGPGPAPVSAFKPIPLTEEWIERLGFERYRSSIYRKGEVYLGKYDDSYQFLNNPTWAGMRYVHSLQNTHFYAFGTEL